MYRLQTRGDFLFGAGVSIAVCALGGAMLAFPGQPLPEQPGAYRQVGGVLRELRDESPRRSTAVTFVVDTEATRFVSRTPGVRDAARTWTTGRTFLQFFVLKDGSDAGGSAWVPAYGLRVEGQPLRSLAQDVAFYNAGVTAWPAVMAIGLGLGGLLVLGLRWRQLRAA